MKSINHSKDEKMTTRLAHQIISQAINLWIKTSCNLQSRSESLKGFLKKAISGIQDAVMDDGIYKRFC